MQCISSSGRYSDETTVARATIKVRTKLKVTVTTTAREGSEMRGNGMKRRGNKRKETNKQTNEEYNWHYQYTIMHFKNTQENAPLTLSVSCSSQLCFLSSMAL